MWTRLHRLYIRLLCVDRLVLVGEKRGIYIYMYCTSPTPFNPDHGILKECWHAYWSFPYYLIEVFKIPLSHNIILNIVFHLHSEQQTIHIEVIQLNTLNCKLDSGISTLNLYDPNTCLFQMKKWVPKVLG